MTEALFALCATAFLLLGSPGPATLTLAAVGATFGFKRGSLFLAGLIGAVVFTISFTMAGVSVIVSHFEPLKIGLQVMGGLYIGYLAYKIASAPLLSYDSINDEVQEDAPGFRDGFILNLINPKAYAAFLSLSTQFMLPYDNEILSYALTALSIFMVVVVVDILWLAVGGLLRPVFAHPVQARVIRVVFAILMVGSVLYAALPA